MPNTRKNPKDPDSPFVTREGMRNAVPFRERFPNTDLAKVSVVLVDDTEDIQLALSRDTVKQLRAIGPGWPQIADDILRDGLKKMKQKAA